MKHLLNKYLSNIYLNRKAFIIKATSSTQKKNSFEINCKKITIFEPFCHCNFISRVEQNNCTHGHSQKYMSMPGLHKVKYRHLTLCSKKLGTEVEKVNSADAICEYANNTSDLYGKTYELFYRVEKYTFPCI